MDQTKCTLYNWPSIKASDVTKYLQIPARRIKHYVELDIVRINEKQPGTGNSRMFTPGNVMEMVLMDRLEGIGIAPKRLARISARLNEAVAGFIGQKADPKLRYLHVAGQGQSRPLGHPGYRSSPTPTRLRCPFQQTLADPDRSG